MQSAHFFIWCALAILITGSCVIVWCVVQLWRGAAAINERLDRVLGELEKSNTGLSNRIGGIESWSASYVKWSQNESGVQSERISGIETSLSSFRESTLLAREDMNKRLISLETENKIPAPRRRDEDDPLSGPRSWSAQAAAASRGEGVELVA